MSDIIDNAQATEDFLREVALSQKPAYVKVVYTHCRFCQEPLHRIGGGFCSVWCRDDYDKEQAAKRRGMKVNA